MASEPRTGLYDLLMSANIRLGQAQRERLSWLVGQYGPARLHDRHTRQCADGIIIIQETPSGPAAELLYRSLHPGCAVLLPRGENPGFDFLKSKLTGFGSVGPCGAEGPHEMWWGGIGWSKLLSVADASTPRPRIISCYPLGSETATTCRLQQSLDLLQLESHIEPIPTAFDSRMLCFEKVEFITRMWSRYSEPLLFIESGSILRAPPLLPSSIGCDVAVHKWNGWEISGRTVYFGRSARAEQLLRAWRYLATLYPLVWEGYLLDQAWSLTSSEVPLDTVWLPPGYHAMEGDSAINRATIVHDRTDTTTDLGPDPGFAGLVRTARRAGRIGAHEAFMVMTSRAAAENGVTVILRDIGANDAGTVAATVEAVTSAFAADCGGHGRLELSLCNWHADIGAAQEAAKLARYRILEIAPGHSIPTDFFASLSSGGDRPLSSALSSPKDATQC